MRERHADDGDAELCGVGEVRQRHAPRLGRLAEDHLARGAVQRAPVAYTPLQRPADTVVREGVRLVHLQMAQQRHRLYGGIALEDRQQHRLPHRLERIGNGAPALGLALGRQAGIGVDPARGALAEPCPGGGGALTVTMSVLHVRSHLLVDDGFARHGRDLRLVTEILVVPVRSGQHPELIPQQEDERAAVSSLRPGYARPPAGDSGQHGCRRRTGWLSLIRWLWPCRTPFRAKA